MYLKEGPITRLEDLRHRRVGWPGLEIDLPILGTMLEDKQNIGMVTNTLRVTPFNGFNVTQCRPRGKSLAAERQAGSLWHTTRAGVRVRKMHESRTAALIANFLE